MKIAVHKLSGAALDWAVAKCEGIAVMHCGAGPSQYLAFIPKGKRSYYRYEPSRNWKQGGPIIEQINGFELKCWLESKSEYRCEAHIHNYDGDWIAFGPMPLVAALRVYVASKFGDEIDLPERLVYETI